MLGHSSQPSRKRENSLDGCLCACLSFKSSHVFEFLWSITLPSCTLVLSRLPVPVSVCFCLFAVEAEIFHHREDALSLSLSLLSCFILEGWSGAARRKRWRRCKMEEAVARWIHHVSGCFRRPPHPFVPVSPLLSSPAPFVLHSPNLSPSSLSCGRASPSGISLSIPLLLLFKFRFF